jgi:hypothetical protein
MKENFKYYRMALGINMLFNAFPIINIFRDGLGLGPKGSIFALIYWGIGLLLLVPFNIFQRIERPNTVLLFFLGSFIVHCLIYMHYRPALGFGLDKAREYAGIIIPMAFLFGLLYYPNDKVDKILPVTIAYSVVGSLGLLYLILHDPTWQFGQRAAIKFATNPDAIGNPHIFANNGIYCFVACIVYSTITTNSITKLICYLTAIFSFVVVVMCRTSTSLIVLIMIIVFALIFRGKDIARQVFNKSSFFVVSFLAIAIGYYIRTHALIRGLIADYYSSLTGRIINTIFTATGTKLGKTDRVVDTDISSVTRVYSFRYVKTMFAEGEWKNILIGEGYKSQFLDVPLLESLTNHGLLGFILYDGFIFILGIYTVSQLLRPTNGFSLYIANICILLLLLSISGGRPTHPDNWLVFMFIIRFLGIEYNKKQLLIPV